jgi:hypothetical protein
MGQQNFDGSLEARSGAPVHGVSSAVSSHHDEASGAVRLDQAGEGG